MNTDYELLNKICEGCTDSYCLLEEMLKHKGIDIPPIKHCLDKDVACPLKQVILEKHLDERLLIQTKLIEKLKWEESSKAKKDIGWREAWIIWLDKGYARNFGENYKLGKYAEKSIEEIYNLVTNRNSIEMALFCRT